MIGLLALAFVLAVIFLKQQSKESEPQTNSAPVSNQPESAPTPLTRPATELLSMEVNKAVMVTAELDFDGPTPTIAQALTQIDRRYKPADGQGRTFAILDAYGEPTPTGKLHISMHVSSEKAGQGSLVFRRTGEILWKSMITPVEGASSGKNLTVYVGDDQGASWVIDGSTGAKAILDAKLRDKPIKVREFWPDGAEREITFVYSACGCPVKVLARRNGERTVRTRELPIIFPDDPAAVQAINGLMGW